MIYKKALRQRLHTAELISDSSRLRILDVGSGTGKWTDEMAAEYPHSEITGFDLVPVSILMGSKVLADPTLRTATVSDMC